MQYSPAHRGASRHPGVERGDGTYFPVGPSSRLFYFGAAIIGRASSPGGRSRAHPLIASTAHAPLNATTERCSHARVNRRDPPAIRLWELRDPHSAANVRGFWQPSTVGTAALLDIGNHQAALRKMFVAATHRGPAHGVARQLLGTLVAWCRTKDVTAVYLGTTAKFLAAHRFYEKNGFREIAREALPGSFPVMAVDTKFYALAL
jgi:GNAT superfamily N-acetyltransferase